MPFGQVAARAPCNVFDPKMLWSEGSIGILEFIHDDVSGKSQLRARIFESQNQQTKPKQQILGIAIMSTKKCQKGLLLLESDYVGKVFASKNNTLWDFPFRTILDIAFKGYFLEQ